MRRIADVTGNIAEWSSATPRSSSPNINLALAELRQQSRENASLHRVYVFENDRLIALALLSETARPALVTLARHLRALVCNPAS